DARPCTAVDGKDQSPVSIDAHGAIKDAFGDSAGFEDFEARAVFRNAQPEAREFFLGGDFEADGLEAAFVVQHTEEFEVVARHRVVAAGFARVEATHAGYVQKAVVVVVETEEVYGARRNLIDAVA